MMKIHLIVLSLLLFVFLGRYAKGGNVSPDKVVGLTNTSGEKDIINIGIIVDMGSWFGKVVESCIKMAVKDFYNNNSQYSTRINLHLRDSMGDSLLAIASALDLLETVKVHALIVPTISNKELFMASLVDKANVPTLSFSAIPSFDEHPYYLQVARDETIEFHGISALIHSFKWEHSVILHHDGTQIQPTLYHILLQNKIGVVYQTLISVSATNDQIVDELRVIMKMKTSVIIVHLSPSLASQVFANAKILGMMSKGFVWIVTSNTMNLLGSQTSSEHELMQGALGFRSYVSASRKLQNFTLRWRKEFLLSDSDMVFIELNVYGIWAYDAVWAIGHAIESAGIKPYSDGVQCNLLDLTCSRVSESGQSLLKQISSSKFIGLAGPFELKNRKLIHENYEIVNVIGKGERRVGYWTSASGLAKEIYPSNNFSWKSTLETIIWPGITTTTPASQLIQTSENSLRVGIPLGTRRPELVSWQIDQQTNVTIADGLCIDVFRAAFNWLKYNISFEFIPFSNGTYSDLVYQVYLQNYDAAVGDITILANRSVYVDFTCPYTDLGVGMVAKMDSKDPWFFTKPLDGGLWIMCACWFLATGIIVWIIERPINEEFQGPLSQQVGTLLWFAVSTLVYAHRERLRSNVSRFVVGIWLFVVLILTSSYTANLSSLLTVQKFKLRKSDYIGSANPLVQGQTVSNLNFGDNRLKPYHSAEDYDEALRKGSKKGGVGAIVDEMPYIKIFLGKFPNEYDIIQTSVTTSGFGFAFPKGSQFVPELSRAIAGLREEGTLLNLEKKWFTGQSVPMLSHENQPPSVDALSVYNFSGLFLISGISKGLAVLILLTIFLRRRLLRLQILAVQRWLLMLRRFHPGMTTR